jgi:hypothetical protein
MKNIQSMLVWLRKMVFASHNCVRAAMAGKKCFTMDDTNRNNAMHLQKRV